MSDFKIRSTDIMMLSGKRGTGKSFFINWYIQNKLLGKIRVVIYDPIWQYGDLGKVIHDIDGIKLKSMDNKKALIFQPKSEEDTVETFDQVAKKIFTSKIPCVFVIEEMNEYMSPNSIPPNFRAMVRRCRNYGQGILGLTHRPAYISLNFLNMVDHWIIFQQDLKVDLKRICEYLDRAKEGITEDEIANMPDRYFIHFFRERETGKARAITCNPLKSNSVNTKAK